MKRVTMLATLIGLLLPAAGRAEDPAPLVLEAKIPLGAVTGRIDHFAFDPDRQLLFVAELGNDSVGIVDLKERKVLHRHHRAQRAAGRRLSSGNEHALCRQRRRRIGAPVPRSDFTPLGGIALGDDADNIRIDPWRNRIVVGYGKGALAVIDPASRRRSPTCR